MCVCVLESLMFFLKTKNQMLSVLLATRNGFVIKFQEVSAKAAFLVDLDAHDNEEDNHMSLISFYWSVVSKKTPHFEVLELSKSCGVNLYLRIF